MDFEEDGFIEGDINIGIKMEKYIPSYNSIKHGLIIGYDSAIYQELSFIKCYEPNLNINIEDFIIDYSLLEKVKKFVGQFYDSENNEVEIRKDLINKILTKTEHDYSQYFGEEYEEYDDLVNAIEKDDELAIELEMIIPYTKEKVFIDDIDIDENFHVISVVTTDQFYYKYDYSLVSQNLDYYLIGAYIAYMELANCIKKSNSRFKQSIKKRLVNRSILFRKAVLKFYDLFCSNIFNFLDSLTDINKNTVLIYISNLCDIQEQVIKKNEKIKTI
jgi:hypothetical protein